MFCIQTSVHLLTAADSKSLSMLPTLDIRAAFDTIDHHHLFQRAKELSSFDDWLQSCLASRKHFVTVDGRQSSTVKLFTGVQQGSMLGLLFFAIFTMLMGKLNNSYGISYYQFADVTKQYTAIKSLSPTSLTVISAYAHVVICCHIRNDLLLNPTKKKHSSLVPD